MKKIILILLLNLCYQTTNGAEAAEKLPDSIVLKDKNIIINNHQVYSVAKTQYGYTLAFMGLYGSYICENLECIYSYPVGNILQSITLSKEYYDIVKNLYEKYKKEQN